MMTRDEILALAGLLARATNGPWRTAKKDPCRVLDSAGTVRVCHAFSSVMRDEIDEANAALIAQAPVMAETLIALQAELDAERAARENVRLWFFFPIEMPLDGRGNGPAKVGEDAAVMTYEVWDQTYTTHASFDNLTDAINDAMQRNRERNAR